MLTLILLLLEKKLISGSPNIQKIICRAIFFTMLYYPATSYSQEYSYSILKGGNQIGTLSAKRAGSDDHLKISIRSVSKTYFILPINIDVVLDESYERGEMFRSTLIHKINGRVRVHNTADASFRGYTLKNNDGDEKHFASPVKYSMAEMYFEAPDDRRFVYSESIQDFIPVVSLDKNRYMIQFPNGNKSYYNYESGLCSLIEVQTEWAVIQFRLNENADPLTSNIK